MQNKIKINELYMYVCAVLFLNLHSKFRLRQSNRIEIKQTNFYIHIIHKFLSFRLNIPRFSHYQFQI